MPTPVPQRVHSSYPFSRFARRGLLLLLTLSLLTVTSAAQSDANTPALEPGKPVERELSGNAAHSYHITAAADQFLYVVVEQKGIDVVVSLFAPDGKKVAEVDSPNGTQGPEPISVVAETAGAYRLEVRSLEAKAGAGRYQAKIEELRSATKKDRSRIAAQQAFAEAQQLQNKGSAESLRKAIGKYQDTLPLWRDAGDRVREAITLNIIGRAYDALGERQKALDFYNQALPLRRAVGDRSGEGATLNNIGLVYDALGERQKALDFYNQALPLVRAVGNKANEAATLSNIGAVYNSLGERQRALDFFNQALPLMHALGDRRGEAVTLNNIGGVYDALGEKQKALDFYDRALALRRAVGDRLGEGLTLNNIGGVYEAIGEQQQALDFFNQALSLMRAVGNRGGEAITLGNIGGVYDTLGERQKALDFYNQSLPLIRAVGNRTGEGITLNNIGLVHDALGERQKALDFYDQALALRRAVGDRFGEAFTLHNVGAVHDALGEKQKALDFYNQALALRQAVSDRRGEAVTLHKLARLERDRGNFNEARARIEAALTIVETLRTKIASRDLRSSYFATTKDYYDLYIDILMRLHREHPSGGYDGAALQTNERARARSLLEILAEANADIRQGVDPALLERERTVQRQLNATAQRQMRVLGGKYTEADAAAVAKELERLTTELRQVEAEIRQKSPRYAALTQPRPLTLREIQTKLLDANTLLLEYSLGSDRSYLWAVTPTAIKSYELPKREEIETAARQFYELLASRPEQATGVAGRRRELGGGLQRQADARLAQAASRLSRMLLAPVAPLLGKKRLLVVGDGALQYIPFAALPAPTARANRATATPLVVKHEVVNLPSASTLAVLRREAGARHPATRTLAALADPVFEKSDERLKARAAKTAARDTEPAAGADESRGLGLVVAASARQSGVADDGLRIPRLPGTRREAEEIVKLVPPGRYKVALDFAASRATATGHDIGQYRYVHFATHGFLNSRHPELSGVVLSMFDERGEPQDGFLRAHEVYNLKLAADVVVLSACRTGLGKEVEGEGLLGLTRGFMYAGAPRVVVSLWDVSDAATAELMARFYRAMLADGKRPAEALRAAQISLLGEERFRSPFYWAAFTIHGEWR